MLTHGVPPAVLAAAFCALLALTDPLAGQQVDPAAAPPPADVHYVLESVNEAPLPSRLRHEDEVVVERGVLVLEKSGEYQLLLEGRSGNHAERLLGDEGIVVPDGQALAMTSGLLEGVTYEVRVSGDSLLLRLAGGPAAAGADWRLAFRRSPDPAPPR